MRTFLFAGAIALAAISTANADDMAASKTPVCFKTTDIDTTHSDNDKTIMFRMRDGSMWRNDLKGNCSGLRFYGFAYTLSGTNEVCGNLQSIRVLKTGSVCVLGPFTQVKPKT